MEARQEKQTNTQLTDVAEMVDMWVRDLAEGMSGAVTALQNEVINAGLAHAIRVEPEVSLSVTGEAYGGFLGQEAGARLLFRPGSEQEWLLQRTWRVGLHAGLGIGLPFAIGGDARLKFMYQRMNQHNFSWLNSFPYFFVGLGNVQHGLFADVETRTTASFLGVRFQPLQLQYDWQRRYLEVAMQLDTGYYAGLDSSQLIPGPKLFGAGLRIEGQVRPRLLLDAGLIGKEIADFLSVDSVPQPRRN